MNDKEKSFQHMLMSFALLGGILVDPRRRAERAESRPQGRPPSGRKPG